MTFDEFNKIQLSLFDDILKIGTTKGKEYASSDDRLANFKRIASELEIAPEKVAYIYFKKHLDSINTYLKVGKELSEESIRGRFLDAINYLTLMYGLVVESKKNTPEYIEHRPNLISNLICERCGHRFQYHEKIHFNSNGDLVHAVCSPTGYVQNEQSVGKLTDIIEKGVMKQNTVNYSHLDCYRKNETTPKETTTSENF